MKTRIPNIRIGQGIDEVISKISKNNLNLIKKTCIDVGQDGLPQITIKNKYETPLKVLCYIFEKDITKKTTKTDFKELNGWINNSKYGWYGKERLRIALKRAIRVLYNTEDNPPISNVIKSPKNDRKKPKTKMPKVMIKTNEEMDKLVKKAKNSRDKFHLAVKWNSGARDTEIDELKFGAIYEEDNKTKIRLDTAKNSGDEKQRTLILSYALPYYHRYKQDFKEMFGIEKDQDLEDLYIFRKFDNPINEPLDHSYWLKVYKEVGKRSNIPNFVPSVTRKWFISRMSRLGVGEQIIKRMVGHSKNSNVMSHYSFMSNQDVEDTMLNLEGEPTKVKIQEPKPSIIICLRCSKPNSIANDTCGFCGFGLSEEIIIKKDLQQNKDMNKMKDRMARIEQLLVSNANLGIQNQKEKERREELVKEIVFK